MAKKYYVVYYGRNPGIYDNWAETDAQVRGFSGGVHVGFENWESARAAYLSFFNLNELPMTIHLPAQFRPSSSCVSHVNQVPSSSCVSHVNQDIAGPVNTDMAMELEQAIREAAEARREAAEARRESAQSRRESEEIRRELEQTGRELEITRRELERSHDVNRLIVEEVKTLRELNDKYRDLH